MTRRHWMPWEEASLAVQYPEMVTAVIAAMLERPVEQVYTKASQLGLRKSPAFFATKASGRINVVTRGVSTRFQKGNVPWTKGLKGWSAGGNAPKTRFKKGHRPANWQPIGAERINGDGYRDRKLTDTGYPPRDWVAIHRINWMAAHGPIPKGFVVAFKDGNKLNTSVENLELRSLVDNMRRNTIHNRYPPDLRAAIQLAGALKRQINRRTRT